MFACEMARRSRRLRALLPLHPRETDAYEWRAAERQRGCREPFVNAAEVNPPAGELGFFEAEHSADKAGETEVNGAAGELGTPEKDQTTREAGRREADLSS